jgi:hypothetical protein
MPNVNQVQSAANNQQMFFAASHIMNSFAVFGPAFS